MNRRENIDFSQLLDGLADAVFVSECLADGTPGNYIYCNQATFDLIGYTTEDLARRSPLDINKLAQENSENYQKVLAELDSEEKVLYRTDLLHKDGHWIHVEMSCRKFDFLERSLFFCSARDISIREKYEETIKALVRSTVGLTGQECLEEITKNLCGWLHVDGACIGLFNNGGFHILACHHQGHPRQPFRVPIEETPLHQLATGLYTFCDEHSADRFAEPCYQVLQGSRCFIGTPMTSHSGSVLGAVCLFSEKPVAKGPHIEEFLAIIASRAAAECERLHYIKELSHSEEMLRTLFNSTAEAIVGIDLHGNIVFCNPSTLKILGYASEEELIGRNFHRTVQDDTLNSSPECPYIKDIEKGARISSETIFTDRTGQPIPVEYWGHPMHRDQQLVGAVITFINITRRKALEQQLQHSQRMEAIGTLTGGIAHDFNNILTVISGYAGLLEAQLADQPKALSKIQKIGAAAERGSKLTHGLLAYSRKKSEPSTPLDLNQLVIRVHEIFGQVIGDQIRRQLVLSKQQMVVLADSAQLEQVLVNLATNARDAMPDGGILTMTTEETEIDLSFCQTYGYGEPGRYALITVEDSGAGIPEAIHQKIFDPFFTTKDTGKGTGLGLAMAWGIVKQHKGYILVDSKPGQGSRFKIYLPISDQKIVYHPVSGGNELRGGEETILLVEDDILVRESTESILTAVGYSVFTCESAETALTFLSSADHPIDIILSDVVMPGLKGPDFYHELRKITSIPIIFMSGYTFDHLREQGLLNDGVPLLHKPIQPVELLNCIHSQLKK